MTHSAQFSAQDMSGRGDHRHSRWAEEVDQEEAQGQAEASGVYDEVSGQYRNSNASWDAGMEVERGQSRHRLDLSHGFMRNIVRVLPARALSCHLAPSSMTGNAELVAASAGGQPARQRCI